MLDPEKQALLSHSGGLGQQIYPIADRSWLKVTGSTIYAPTLTALQLLREQMHSLELDPNCLVRYMSQQANSTGESYAGRTTTLIGDLKRHNLCLLFT